MALGTLLTVAAVVGVVVSIASRVPDPLPAAALGSEAVFHAERALLLFLPVLIVMTVVAQTFRVGLPTEFSLRDLSAKYLEDKVEESSAGADAGLEGVNVALGRLRVDSAELRQGLREQEAGLAELRTRLDAPGIDPAWRAALRRFSG